MTNASPTTAEKFAVARMVGGQPRFFLGFTEQTAAHGLAGVLITPEPDKAREYDSRVIAELMVDFLDFLDSTGAGERRRNWIVMPLPEEWL
ncbi:hypothetical protein [Rhodopseudomonas sp.]|uniref:hypothetical protein n=1 Tax=Rhodopseudomonas sp. TaxID=1078 RepID=UPI003B3B1899